MTRIRRDGDPFTPWMGRLRPGRPEELLRSRLVNLEDRAERR